MPRPRALSSFPRQFWDITARTALKKEVFRTTVPTRGAAASLQGRFYAFRGALKREVDRTHAEPARYGPGEVDSIRDAYAMACSVVLWWDKKQTVPPIEVKFIHRDLTRESLILVEMLNSSKPTDAVEPGTGDREIEASIARMMAALEKGAADANSR